LSICFFDKLKIKKDWTRKTPRPIRSFVEKMNVDRNNYSLDFFEIKQVIQNHKDLKEYWNRIQDVLDHELKIDPVIAMEVIDVIRGLERGYLSSRMTTSLEQIDFSKYIDSNGASKIGSVISYATRDISKENIDIVLH